MGELLKDKDICDKLKMSRSKLYKLREQGMPIIKNGKTVWYDYEEVIEWLKNNNKA